jgi:PAS domain S-box-containing protein
MNMSKPTYEMLEQRVRQLEGLAAEREHTRDREGLEKERAQSYLDIARVAILALNGKGEVTLINRRGCEILGREEEEVLGKRWVDHFLPERIRNEVATVLRKILAGDSEPLEYYQNPVLTKTGEERTIDWYNTLIRDRSGKAVGTLSSGEDVTERVKAQEALARTYKELAHFSNDLEILVEERTEELKEKNKQLVEAERLAALGRIANSVAHDLRNPLTVIGGFARRMFETTPDDDPNKRYLRIMIEEVMRLENRVSQIISMEQAEKACEGLSPTSGEASE